MFSFAIANFGYTNDFNLLRVSRTKLKYSVKEYNYKSMINAKIILKTKNKMYACRRGNKRGNRVYGSRLLFERAGPEHPEGNFNFFEI